MIFSSPDEIPQDIANKFDAILVLGGGVPINPNSPPNYVQKRCDYAAQVYASAQEDPKPNILALSAGTAHLPQLISADGLPVWESTATASYLLKKYEIDPQHVYVETTSYDTISNAFFARNNFCDIASWKQLLIITNEFHLERTQVIFNWIMNAPSSSGSKESQYKLFYLSVPNDGISDEAVQIRKEKEAKSAQNVKHVLMKRYTTLYDIWMFLTQQHSFYNSQMLVDRANMVQKNFKDQKDFQMLHQSYGGSFYSSNNLSKCNLRSVSTFLGGLLTGVVLSSMWIVLVRHSRGLSKVHST